jgi:serine/threonine protein kinase
MPLTNGTRLGPYEIVAALGAGGMGEVYRARDTRLDRTVAIKVLSEQFAADSERRQRFEREARAGAALNHPHICNLYDVGDAPNPQSQAQNPEVIPFLVMECLEGQTLADRLLRGPLPRRRSCAMPLSSPMRSITRIGVVSSIAISSPAT